MSCPHAKIKTGSEIINPGKNCSNIIKINKGHDWFSAYFPAGKNYKIRFRFFPVFNIHSKPVAEAVTKSQFNNMIIMFLRYMKCRNKKFVPEIPTFPAIGTAFQFCKTECGPFYISPGRSQHKIIVITCGE